MKSEGAKNTYQGLFGLDRLPKEIKALNWAICLIIAIRVAFSGYFDVGEVIAPNLLMRSFFEWLALVSPICIAVAWLRLTGVKWLHALLLFVFVPVAVNGIRLVFGILYALMGD